MKPTLNRRHIVRYAGAAMLLPAMGVHAKELEDLDRVRASGVLKVALYKDNAPYSDGAASQLHGVDVALAQGLANELNLRLQMLPFDAGENMGDDLRNMVWRGHYLGYGPADVMLHVPADKFLMRENRQVLIFAPYSRETLVVFHNRQRLPDIPSGDALAGHVLAAERGSGAASALMGYQSGLLRDRVKIYDNGVQAAQAVLNGEADAAYVTRAQAEAAIHTKAAPGQDFAVSELGLPGLVDHGWPLGMAVKSGNTALASALESALQRLRDKGQLQAMFRDQGLTLVAP